MGTVPLRMSPGEHHELGLAAERERLLQIARDLRGELARLRDLVATAAPASPPPRTASDHAIRLDAISLAVNGASRDEVERELQGRHGDLPPGLLDSVFGDQPRLEWGGAESP